MPLIKSSVRKGFCSPGVVKTSFSKLVVLDEVSETNEEHCRLCIMVYFGMSPVFACLDQLMFFFCVTLEMY